MINMSAKSNRGRGRPRSADKLAASNTARKEQKSSKAAPREELLKVAANLFSAKGYAGTTMAEIADIVGIRSPSLYYHFSDKPDILRAIADIILDQAVSGSHDALRHRERPATQRLYGLVHGLVCRLCACPYNLTCMFDPAFQLDEFRAINKKLQVWLGELESLIREGIEAGSFEPQNARVATRTVRGLIECAIRHPGGTVRTSPKETADYIADFALKGLLADTSLLDEARAGA